MIKHYYNDLLFPFFFLFTLPHLKAIINVTSGSLNWTCFIFWQLGFKVIQKIMHKILIRNVCILFYVALRDVENTVPVL